MRRSWRHPRSCGGCASGRGEGIPCRDEAGIDIFSQGKIVAEMLVTVRKTYSNMREPSWLQQNTHDTVLSKLLEVQVIALVASHIQASHILVWRKLHTKLNSQNTILEVLPNTLMWVCVKHASLLERAAMEHFVPAKSHWCFKTHIKNTQFAIVQAGKIRTSGWPLGFPRSAASFLGKCRQRNPLC